MINVLHLSKTICAGSPIRIVQCLNKYSDNQINANLITLSNFKGNNRLGNLDYNYDNDKVGFLYDHNQIKQYQDLFDQADIIHCHNYDMLNIIPNRNIFNGNKKLIYHHHNALNPNSVNFSKYNLQLVVGQYQPAHIPNAYIVPNVIDIYDDLLTPCNNNNDIPIVFYSVASSSEKDGTANDKGIRYIVPILKELEGQKIIKAEIHTNTPYNELMSIKKWCDICIDDIMTGSFHLTSLEALSQGLITITSINDNTQKVFNYLVNWKYKEDINVNPFYRANKDNLREKILKIITKNKYSYRNEIRAFMETHWHPKNMVNYYIDIYQSLLNNIKPKITKRFIDLKE